VQLPNGEQFLLSHDGPSGHATAAIMQRAASLREYRVEGIDVVEPYGEAEETPYGSGIVLVPWPNRVRDGEWMLDGEPQQLDITEPAFHNAIHGLLQHTLYTPLSWSADTVTLAATVEPQAGYPFRLETRVRYQLEDDGLTVTHTIRNVSKRSAPVAVGAHPYLRIGDVPTADLTLRVAAGTQFEADGQFIPTSEGAIDDALVAGAPLATLELNDTFGEVPFTDGRAVHSVTAPDGRSVELWQDASLGYVQVYTCRTFPSAGGERFAVAIEPMTAPPNALATGQGLRWLERDEQWELRWGIRPRL
jgi:aldose 1-epimerase